MKLQWFAFEVKPIRFAAKATYDINSVFEQNAKYYENSANYLAAFLSVKKRTTT